MNMEFAEPTFLLRPEAAARALAISRTRIYELLASGAIPSIKLGTSRRIPVEALKRWVEQQSAEVEGVRA